jgi:hypothetical protein
MDKAHKSVTLQYYTPLSDPLRIYHYKEIWKYKPVVATTLKKD